MQSLARILPPSLFFAMLVAPVAASTAEAPRVWTVRDAGVTLQFARGVSGTIDVSGHTGDPRRPKIQACNDSPIVSLARHWVIRGKLDRGAGSGVTVTVDYDPADVPAPFTEERLNLFGPATDGKPGWQLVTTQVDTEQHRATARFDRLPSELLLGVVTSLCPVTGVRVVP